MLSPQEQTQIYSRIVQMEFACLELVSSPESVHYEGGPLYTLFCELDALRGLIGMPRRAIEVNAL
jgi:hypothetical protein